MFTEHASLSLRVQLKISTDDNRTVKGTLVIVKYCTVYKKTALLTSYQKMSIQKINVGRKYQY